MRISCHFISRFLTLPTFESKFSSAGGEVFLPKFDLEKIIPILVRQGFEVDSVEKHGESLQSVVVGCIRASAPHPQAQKLRVCQVDVGGPETLQIVCGAPNARDGLLVAVALPGTVLPNGMNIAPVSLRGVESSGMLCSRGELGLPVNPDVDGDGIWELNQDAHGGQPTEILHSRLGFPVFFALGLDDVILELSVTPNRPDALCHAGIARELEAGFAYAKIPFQKNKFSFYSSLQQLFSCENIQTAVLQPQNNFIEDVPFQIENHLDIPAFFIILDGVRVGPSPAWLRNLLESLGQSAIHNLVDISNFILLAFGQPSHVFDLDKVCATADGRKKISIRNAYEKEHFLGLDGKERFLCPADAVVADEKQVISLLGVLGGDSSKVTENTKSIAIEFANPQPVAVRKTARRYGKRTDASFLFEKGIDPAFRFQGASEFLCLLQATSPSVSLQKLCALSTHYQDPAIVEAMLSPRRTIGFDETCQARILGASLVSFETQKEILRSLGFKLTAKGDSALEVCVPSWRHQDVVGVADLVEECVRVVGLDAIPSIPMVAAVHVGQDDSHFLFLNKVTNQAVRLGYHEVISLHFMRSDDYQKCKFPCADHLGKPIALLNPILGDEPWLHNTLVPDLLRKASKNIHYGVKDGQLFQVGRTFQNANEVGQEVFLPAVPADRSCPLDATQNSRCEYGYDQSYAYSRDGLTTRPVETPRLAGVVFGCREQKTWQNQASQSWTLHDLMSHAVELCRIAGVAIEFFKMTDDSCSSEHYHPFAPALHPGRRVAFRSSTGTCLGWCGELHPYVAKNYEIDRQCFAFELNLANLMRCAGALDQAVNKVVTTQRFQLVTRDFAFLVEKNLPGGSIETAISELFRENIQKSLDVRLLEARIFDIYEGKGIPENKKSLAVKVVVEPVSKTLTEKEISFYVSSITGMMAEKFQSALRT